MACFRIFRIYFKQGAGRSRVLIKYGKQDLDSSFIRRETGEPVLVVWLSSIDINQRIAFAVCLQYFFDEQIITRK
jgi:hypothetical protein